MKKRSTKRWEKSQSVTATNKVERIHICSDDSTTTVPQTQEWHKHSALIPPATNKVNCTTEARKETANRCAGT